MRTAFVALGAALTLALAACDPVNPCPGQEVCGSGCMTTGSSCCPDGVHYCDGGSYCGTDNRCHYSGGGGGGGNTCPVNTCINNLCSPGLWCCTTGCQSCGCR